MAIENEVIVQGLESKGLDIALASNLTFETEEQMNATLESLKPRTFESIEDVLKDEKLSPIVRNYGDKRLSDLQSKIDSEKAKQKPIETPNPEPPKFEMPEDVKQQLASIEAMKAKLDAQDFEKMVSKQCVKAGFTDADDIQEIMDKLKPGSTSEEVAAKIEAHKNYLTKKGIKAIGSPGGGGKSNATLSTLKKMAAKNVKS